MTILVAINEVNMDIPSGVTPGGTDDVRYDKETSTSKFDSDYSRGNVRSNESDACTWPLINTVQYDEVGEIWVHFFSYNVSSQDVEGLILRDASQDDIIKIRKNCGTTSLVFEITTYDDAGSVVGFYVTGNLYEAPPRNIDIDIRLTFDNLGFGSTEIFIDNEFKVALPLDTARTNSPVVSELHFEGSTPSNNFGFSQLIVTHNEPTIGWKVKDINPDGAGNHSAWTGAYTDVNENLYDPTDENTIVGAGRQSYTYDDVQAGIQTGQEVKGVTVATVAAADAAATAPNVQNFVRTNATDYDLGSPVDVENGDNRSAISDLMITNPDTGNAWTFSEVNGAEFGFKSS